MSRVLDIRRFTLAALMAALVFVLTFLPRIPTPIGYIHLGDVGIVFASVAFGPWVAFIAGGVGTALADIAGGYGQWALASFLVHGVQGVLIGLWVRRMGELLTTVVAVVVSVVVVVGGYFVAGWILIGVGAATSEIPFNAVQAAVGGLLGAALYVAVTRAYPPLRRYREG